MVNITSVCYLRLEIGEASTRTGAAKQSFWHLTLRFGQIAVYDGAENRAASLQLSPRGESGSVLGFNLIQRVVSVSAISEEEDLYFLCCFYLFVFCECPCVCIRISPYKGWGKWYYRKLHTLNVWGCCYDHFFSSTQTLVGSEEQILPQEEYSSHF